MHPISGSGILRARDRERARTTTVYTTRLASCPEIDDVQKLMMSSSGILCRLIIPKQLVTASSRSRTVESVSTIFCSHYHNSYPTAVSPPPRLLFHRWNSNKSTAGSSPTKSDEQLQERHPDAEKEPLPEWPGGVNPHTGERGGPKGPEPTRYGDWERKGRVSDF